jgi:hypothetical protein
MVRPILLGVLALLPVNPWRAADAPVPPNVVMIVGDDMAWTDFGFMGHDVVKTPRLDALAGESAVFPNGYVPTSLCRASLATLLTGEYAHQHRICCNDPPDGVARDAMHPFIREAPALPRLLAGAGYASLQTGKFWEGHFSNAGFTDGMTETGRHGDAGLVIGRQRPETASGVTFVTLEDEDGLVNVVVWRDLGERHRRVLLESRLLLVEGRLESSDGVQHLIAGRLEDYTPLLGALDVRSRDFR